MNLDLWGGLSLSCEESLLASDVHQSGDAGSPVFGIKPPAADANIHMHGRYMGAL